MYFGSDKYQLVEVEDGDEGGGDASEGAALGRLSAAQIEKGQAVLANIKATLSNSSSGKANPALLALSSQFYSLIPTASGRVKPPPLDNADLVTEKEGLLEFWLRMGFEGVASAALPGASPIDGVRELPLPPSLQAAAGGVSDAGSINESKVTPPSNALAAKEQGERERRTIVHRGLCCIVVSFHYYASSVAIQAEFKCVYFFHTHVYPCRMWHACFDELFSFSNVRVLLCLRACRQARGAALAKDKAGNPAKPMPADLYAAICLYTGNSIYRSLNQALRENWQAVKPYRNYLRMYFEAMDRLPHQVGLVFLCPI